VLIKNLVNSFPLKLRISLVDLRNLRGLSLWDGCSGSDDNVQLLFKVLSEDLHVGEVVIVELVGVLIARRLLAQGSQLSGLAIQMLLPQDFEVIHDVILCTKKDIILYCLRVLIS
jgi:hypothetical protein